MFLNSDIQGDGREYLREIENILNGITGKREVSGNICTIEISKTSTKIIDNFSEEESIVNTTDLKKLIEEWIAIKNIR